MCLRHGGQWDSLLEAKGKKLYELLKALDAEEKSPLNQL